MPTAEALKAAGRIGFSALTRRVRVPGMATAVERLWPALAPRCGLVDTKIGRSLHVQYDIRDEIQRHIYFGLYEPHIVSLVRAHLAGGDTFFDLGANVGYFSLLASEIVGEAGKVYAFEPVPENCRALERAIQANSLHNVVVEQAAVIGPGCATANIFVRVGAGNSGLSSILDSRRYQTRLQQVPATTLDEYIARAGIDRVRLMKIDIEGAEPMALQGAARLLAREDAPDVVCEVNQFLLRQRGMSGEDLAGLFSDFGYCVSGVGTHGLSSVAAVSRSEVFTVYASKR